MQPQARRVCPGCQSLMGKVFAKAVELDFCQFCGGLWFERGEVLAVTGQPESLAPGFAVEHSCPDCRTPMGRATLHGCEVERCRGCSGTYVPPDTLERLAGEKVRLLPIPDASRRAESLDFLCGGCHERFPLSEAVTAAHGLSCFRCMGAMEEVGPSATAVPGDLLGRVGPGTGTEPTPEERMRPWIEGIATVLGFFL